MNVSSSYDKILDAVVDLTTMYRRTEQHVAALHGAIQYAKNQSDYLTRDTNK